MKAGTSESKDIPYYGHPLPEVTIAFNDGEVRDAKRIVTKVTDKQISLCFNDAERPDTGDYLLTLSNKFGKCSGTVKLTVLGKLSETFELKTAAKLDDSSCGPIFCLNIFTQCLFANQ